jgi:hypothetical protein
LQAPPHDALTIEADKPATPSARERAAPSRMAWAWLAPLALFIGLVVLALPPRLLDTDRFVTTDELFWIGRSAAFAKAVQTGRFADAFQSGHPGVTTMVTAWVGMGNAFAGDLAPSRREVSRREESQSPSFMPALGAARRAFGVVTALGVGLIGVLAWRLFGLWPAVLGGALLALDPFFLAHARLVHIDASLTLWTSLALLAALVRWSGGGWWSLLLAGAATGLALLSKAPALILLPMVPVMGLVVRGPRVLLMRHFWRDLIVWGAVAGLIYLALWPAMWVAPIDTLTRVLGFVHDNANPAHAAAADEDGGGALFYPLVFLFRSTPLTWLGLFGLALTRPRGLAGRACVGLLIFVVAFSCAMTIAAKNFDRYLLPIFPVVDLMAGLGLWRLACAVSASRFVSPLSRWSERRGGALRAGVALLAVTSVLTGWWVVDAWPYELTYANPLLGGNPAAHRTIASGWGEGLDQAATYLNGRPNAARLKAAMPGEIYTTVLDPQLRGTVAPAEGADAAAYDALVVYVRNRQLSERPPFFDDELLTWMPERTITLGGVEYAWVYDTRAGAPVGAVFDDALALEGYGLDTVAPRLGRQLEVRLRWRPSSTLMPGYQVVVELRPDSGGRIVSTMLPLQRPDDSLTWASNERAAAAYTVPILADLPAGSYVVAVRLLDPGDSPVRLTRQPDRPPGVASEPDAVPLRRVQIR